jgi:hypothetical protein
VNSHGNSTARTTDQPGIRETLAMYWSRWKLLGNPAKAAEWSARGELIGDVERRRAHAKL